jgi:hypothetical protein
MFSIHWVKVHIVVSCVMTQYGLMGTKARRKNISIFRADILLSWREISWKNTVFRVKALLT